MIFKCISVVLCLFASKALAAQTYIDLTGQHYITTLSGDELGVPNLTAESWTPIDAPNRASWKNQIGDSAQVQYWRRIDFTISQEQRAELYDPYFFIGSVIGGESIYLNGIKIASYATLDQSRYTWASTNIFVGTRLVQLPRDALLDGANTIHIKHGRFYLQNATIYDGPIGIGNYGVAVEQISKKKSRYDIYSGILLFVDIISVLAFVVLLIALPITKTTFWLSVSFLTYGITAIPLSPHVRAFEGAVSDGWEVLAVKFNLAVVAAIPQFMAAILGLRIGWSTRLFQFGVLAPVLLSWPFRNELSIFLKGLTDPLWLPSTLALLLVVVVTSCRSVLSGDPRAIPLVAAIAVLVGAYVYDFNALDREFILFFGFELRAFAVRLFPFFFLVAAMIDYRMKNAAYVAATQDAAQAKANERQRLGQDLHDGIGQMLSSAKMNAQLLGANTKGDIDQDINELVTQLDHAIADTRNLAHELTPSLIQADGFIQAMHKQAQYLSRGAAVSIKVDALFDQEHHVSQAHQGELFKIFQEAVQNALKHSQASAIDVFFRCSEKGFTFHISDNGCGFKPTGTNASLGLASLSARAAALGAKLSVRSGNGQGTRLIIETKT